MIPEGSRPQLRIAADASEPDALPLQSGKGWWRRLIWGEWFSHNRLLLWTLVGWLAAVWILPLVAHPLWLLGYGLVFATIAGPAFGGSDVIHGCEEFGFGSPIPRSHRFLARLTVGGGSLLAITVMNVLALEGNLSDVLLGVFVTSGLPVVQIGQPLLLYALVLAVPFAVFAIGFTLSALASSRSFAMTSWLWGVLVALILLRGTFQLEELRSTRISGMLSVPALVGVASAVLWVGFRFYRRKEAVASSSSSLQLPASWWAGIASILAAIGGIALLSSWFVANFARLL